MDSTGERIDSAKRHFGKRLVILGHHYQREEVIRFADFRGDSFGLSKIASEQKDAEFIVFCGVHFMAEAARILARPKQRVFMPVVTAGCPMANMAGVEDVERAWAEIAKVRDIKKIVPVAYMNTTAEIKAFCGSHGGVICTSGNAGRVFDWAFSRGDGIFFFPDEHLGRNTARGKGIRSEKIMVWSPSPLAGEGRGEGVGSPRVILWPGFCHVHTLFTAGQVAEARRKYPGCKVIVHPECREDVVMASDESGSTEGICRFVAAQPRGATIVIGTEINLIGRLAHENPEKTVVPLARSLCPNMYKTSAEGLADLLDGLQRGEYANEITVPPNISKDAIIALQRMLSI